MDGQRNTHEAGRSFAAPKLILLATDLEDDLEHLLPYAVAQARASKAICKLVHVIPPADGTMLDARAIFPADAAEAEHHAKQRLSVVAANLRASSIPCDVLIRPGLPAIVVPELVQETGADRLILGTHGRRHLKKLILGSVANEILRKVSVPVCTVGPQVRRPTSAEPQKLLHPVSLAPGYEPSARMALQIAQFHKAAITLLHVLPHDASPADQRSHLLDSTRTQLEQLVREQAPPGIQPTLQIETGPVVEQILHVAEEMQADLIVLGVNPDEHHWPIEKDDTAYEIITRAKSPVLTLRRHPFDQGSEKEREPDAPSQSG
ncbi:MAG: universal stress protein [Acidobacteriaceae bacterium]